MTGLDGWNTCLLGCLEDGWVDGGGMGVRVRRGAGTSSRNEEERTRNAHPKKRASSN